MRSLQPEFRLIRPHASFEATSKVLTVTVVVCCIRMAICELWPALSSTTRDIYRKPTSQSIRANEIVKVIIMSANYDISIIESGIIILLAWILILNTIPAVALDFTGHNYIDTSYSYWLLIGGLSPVLWTHLNVVSFRSLLIFRKCQVGTRRGVIEPVTFYGKPTSFY